MALNYPNRQYKAILVTISVKQAEFIRKMNFKPSHLLQQAINRLMESYNPTDIKTLFKINDEKMKQLTETIIKQREVLDKNGLLTEFIK